MLEINQMNNKINIKFNNYLQAIRKNKTKSNQI